MSEVLIEGINPLVISKITYCRFKRHGGHPYYDTVIKRNWGKGWMRNYRKMLHDIAWKLRFIEYAPDWGYISRPGVMIYGADGSKLKFILCKTNDEAEYLATVLNARLKIFLSNISFKPD